MKLTLFAALIVVLSGCNTLEGFGRDVSNGVRAVDRAL